MGTLTRLKKKLTKDNYFNYGRKFALVSNVLFECISVALFIGGLVVRFRTQAINSTTLQKIKDSVTITFGVSLSTDNFRPITESLYQAFGTALILIGLFTAPCSVLGFYSIYRKNRRLLVAYVVIVGCLLSVQVVMNYDIITHPETLQQWMKPYLQEKINEYSGIHSTDQISLGWNYLMQEYQCCGIDSAADFKSSLYYTQSTCYYYYYYGYNVPGCCKTLPIDSSYYYCSTYQLYCGGYAYDLNYWTDCNGVHIPLQRCSDMGVTVISILYPSNGTCYHWNSNVTVVKGCLQVLFNASYSRNTRVIWAMAGIAVLVQILLIAFTVTLSKDTKCKIEPSTSSAISEYVIWTAGSHTITGEHNQLPPTATTLEPKPSAARIQQPKAMTSTARREHSFYSAQVPPPTTPASTPPPKPQPELQANASRQHSFYPAQPFLPGSVILAPTSVDNGQMTKQNSHISMAHPTTDTQLPPRTPTSLPPPGEQPTYVQTPAAIQPEIRRTLTVTEVTE